MTSFDDKNATGEIQHILRDEESWLAAWEVHSILKPL